MSLAAWLNRPGPIRWIWRPGYELGYQALKGVVFFISGPFWRVRLVGPRPKLPSGGVLLCPNHASYLDPAFVQLVIRRRVTFVMTNDFYSSPWGRWFYKLVGAIPVGRGRLARRGIRRAMALVRRGHAVVVFPEGRLTLDGHLNPPQRGAARVARRTGVPVIPVAISGSMRAWAKGRRLPGLARVRIAFGTPMQHAPMASGDPRAGDQAFAERLMARIAQIKRRLQQMAPAEGDVPPYPTALQEGESSGR